MKSKKKKEYWIIDRDWKGNFKVLQITEVEAKTASIKVFNSKRDAEKGIGNIYIDQPYS
jgi:hypothetical protein